MRTWVGSAAGYGQTHKRLRKMWMTRIARQPVGCARCGKPITSQMAWDLGHNDFDRSRYSGPEHRRCNRATSGRQTASTGSRVW